MAKKPRFSGADGELKSLDAAAEETVSTAEDAQVVAYPLDRRPNIDELKAAFADSKSVEVVMVGPDARGKVAGLNVDRERRVFPLARVFECGPDYVRALAIDDRIDVRIV